MKKITMIAAAWLAMAAPSFAEQYNIVCPIPGMGTAQAGGATVAQGFIFSVDLDNMRACLRPSNKCSDLIVHDNATALPNDGTKTIEYNIVTDAISVLSPEATMLAGVCRRAPFQELPAD